MKANKYLINLLEAGDVQVDKFDVAELEVEIRNFLSNNFADIISDEKIKSCLEHHYIPGDIWAVFINSKPNKLEEIFYPEMIKNFIINGTYTTPKNYQLPKNL